MDPRRTTLWIGTYPSFLFGGAAERGLSEVVTSSDLEAVHNYRCYVQVSSGAYSPSASGNVL